MEIKELHRGRLLDHLQLVVRDLDASKRFYEAVLGALGRQLSGEGDGFFWCDELVVSTAQSMAALGQRTGRTHFAFQTRDRAMVDAFHRVGLQHGGTNNGAPGLRPYHPDYYAAFLMDPDGNNVEAVFHGSSIRSAEWIVISF